MNDRIVVATNGSPTALGSLRMARALAERDGRRVEVLGVYEPLRLQGSLYSEMLGTVAPREQSGGVEALRTRVRAQLAEVGGVARSWPLRSATGRATTTIARFAGERRARILLVGLRQAGHTEQWLARQSLLRLVHLTHVPLLAVPPDAPELPATAVFAIDFSEFSLRAAREAVRWTAPGARIHLVHVAWHPPAEGVEIGATDPLKAYRAAAGARLEDMSAGMEDSTRLTVEAHVRDGDPGREILRLAAEVGAQLIASGSHGAGFFGRIVLGSVSSRLVHGARCALFIAPPTEAARETLELEEYEVPVE